MDPVAFALLVTFVVLWAAYGVGLLREWLTLRRRGESARERMRLAWTRWTHDDVREEVAPWHIDGPAGGDEDRRRLN